MGVLWAERCDHIEYFKLRFHHTHLKVAVHCRRMCTAVRKGLGHIYISRSACIYRNLAFEEYLLRNTKVEQDGDVILFWRLVDSGIERSMPFNQK